LFIQDVTTVLPGMLQSPVLGQANFLLNNGNSAVQSCLFVNATNAVYAALLVNPDPLGDFVNAFFARLSGDGDLAGVFDQIKSDFGRLFTASSVTQFFNTVLITLLDIIEALLVGALAVANAFIDGLLAVIADAIAAIMSILTTEIHIPVLAWLYETLFGEKLTFLNVVTLVASIPVTLIYRVVEGQYPSQALGPTGAVQAAWTTVAAPWVQKLFAGYTAMFTFGQGVINAMGDAFGDALGKVGSLIAKLSAGMGLIITACSTPAISNANPGADDWVVFGIEALWALASVLALDRFKLADQEAVPWVTMMMGLMIAGTIIYGYFDEKDFGTVANLIFAAGLAGALPSIVNPLRLVGEPGVILVSGLDLYCGIAVCVIDFIGAFADLDAPTPRRLHFPWIAFNPAAVRAEPQPLFRSGATP
jgi:hypothetical protein